MNSGLVDCFVAEVTIYLRPHGARGEVPEFTLFGRNDFPLLNPPLPAPLRSGEAINRLTKVQTLLGLLRTGEQSGIEFEAVRAQVRLSTGERIDSDDVPIALLATAS